MAKTSIQLEENALLVMVVLGESVVSARVKKYFFAQRTMKVASNVFLPLEKQELNFLFFEIKSCFEISLRIQSFLLAPPPPEVDVSLTFRPARRTRGGIVFDVGFPQTLSVTIKPGTIHNNKVFRAASSC